MVDRSKDKLRRFRPYHTERLTSIPSMASAISRKISEFQQQYRKLIDDAKMFFAESPAQQTKLASFKKKIIAYDKQIDIINAYKIKHGKFPQIKDQPSTARYLDKLHNNVDQYKKAYRELDYELGVERGKRYQQLDHLLDNILDLLDGPKIFSQFLGTMSLSTPLPDEKVRCLRNEKNKPIYVAALAVALFEEVRRNHEFSHPYLKDNIDDIFDGQPLRLMASEEDQFNDIDKMKYREELLKPIAKAAMLKFIGSYSLEAEAIYDGNRYRQLDELERDDLLNIIRTKSLSYMKLAIGIPPKRFDSREEKQAYQAYEQAKLGFCINLIDTQKVDSYELRDLINIPMVYSSFMLCTKPEHDYRRVFEAYDIIDNGIENNRYVAKFARLFLNMVGRFPLGSGLYFISNETEQIERAVVSSLYPERADTPICKQITRQQIQSLSQAEVVISRTSNIYFPLCRKLSEFEDAYFEQRFSKSYVWNPNELWEVQIPALTFWKKDGLIKYN